MHRCTNFSSEKSNKNTNEPNAKEQFQLSAAADMGALMIDGLTDGLWLMNNGNIPQDDIEQTAFGILQAGRLRMVKTEYISCPGCGRTLYDLRTTIARIKEATKGMTGLKDWHYGLHCKWSWRNGRCRLRILWVQV